MKTSYTITNGFVSVAVGDAMPYAAATKFVRSLAADPKYQPGMPLLVDLRPATGGWHWRSSEYWSFVEYLSDYVGAEGLCCAIVLEEELGFAGDLMVQTVGASIGVTARVFDDADDAVDWLTSE